MILMVFFMKVELFILNIVLKLKILLDYVSEIDCKTFKNVNEIEKLKRKRRSSYSYVKI